MGQATLIRKARIFDGAHVLDDDTVLVREGVIAAVGSDLALPAGARVIEGAGLTLLPGLIDAHTHTFRVANLQQAPIFGVTTVLDMGTYWRAAQRIKALLRTDEGQDLADLRTATTMITAPGGHGTQFGVPIPTLTAPEEAQDFIDARIAEGAEYIKIVYDNREQATGKPEPTLSKEAVAALIAAAHRRGKRAVVHVLKLRDARDAIAAGADGLAHVFADDLPDAAFATLAAESHIFVIPTLAIQEYVCGVADGAVVSQHPALAPYLSDADKAQLQRPYGYTFGTYGIAEEAVRQLKAAGVPILAGTDAPLAAVHGASLHRELELLVRAGLTPLEALAAATSVPARVFALPDRGRIAPGLRADLLLVRGDPTSDILATREIVATWKQGVEIDRQAYRRHLRQQALQQAMDEALSQELATTEQAHQH